MNSKALPPLNWLRTFQVSAQCLNFTHAAEELCLTQGVVSQQIRLLEGHLGVTLFKRLPRGLSLTEEGKSYFPVVKDAISRLSVGTNEIFNQRKKSVVKIRGSLSFFSYWLAPKLKEFSDLHPSIDIRYVSNIWVKELEDEDDLEIRWGHGEWDGLIAQRLTWDFLVPVCSPELLAKQPLKEPADLANHSLLHVLGYEEGWMYWLNCMEVGHIDAAAGMQFDTLVSTLRMAELGQGVALARSSIVKDMITEERLVAPLGQSIEASESFYLVYRSGIELPDETNVFSDWLIKRVHTDQ